MKQYLLAVYSAEGGADALSEEEIQRAYQAVDAFNSELQTAGVWVFAGGLHPSSTATVVRAQGGQVITTDGPYAETKDIVLGFIIVEARDLGEATELARGCPMLQGEGSVEVRAVDELRAGER